MLLGCQRLSTRSQFGSMPSSEGDGSFVSGSEYEAMGCRSSAVANSILVISAPSVRDGSFVSSVMLSAAFRSDCCGSPAVANSILVISAPSVRDGSFVSSVMLSAAFRSVFCLYPLRILFC